MNALTNIAELFEPAERGTIHKRFRLLTRRGELLLALPRRREEAAATLSLYAPQRRAARAMVATLRGLLRARLPLPLAAAEVRISPEDPLARFLSGLCPAWQERDSGLGMLAGNPRAKGRRHVLMLFENGRATAVVKAGVDAHARALIASEAAFLLAAACPGISAPRAVLESARVHAFAMEPLTGESPRDASAGEIRRVLEPWLAPEMRMPLCEIPAWESVRARCVESPLWKKHCAAVADRAVAPAVSHGDFAPWNIKVHPASGEWQVFDWERGSLRGVPGWDWLHFEIQTAILVRRESVQAILARVERLFSAPEFRAYAATAEIAGMERALLAAYLLHCAEVQTQTEGADTIRGLGESL